MVSLVPDGVMTKLPWQGSISQFQLPTVSFRHCTAAAILHEMTVTDASGSVVVDESNDDQEMSGYINTVLLEGMLWHLVQPGDIGYPIY